MATYSYSQVQLTIANLQAWILMTIVETIMSTKARLLSPSLKYLVSGLDPYKVYTASIVVERVDDFKYCFKGGNWCPWSASETTRPHPQVVFHKDGSRLGSDWMTEGIDFSWIQLFAKMPEVDREKALVLEFKHLYQPRLVFSCEDDEFVLEDPVQRFIPMSNVTPRLKALKKQLKEQEVSIPVPKRKRGVSSEVEEPVAKRTSSIGMQQQGFVQEHQQWYPVQEVMGSEEEVAYVYQQDPQMTYDSYNTGYYHQESSTAQWTSVSSGGQVVYQYSPSTSESASVPSSGRSPNAVSTSTPPGTSEEEFDLAEFDADNFFTPL